MHEVYVRQIYSRSREYKIFGEERHYYNARVARKYTHYDIDVCGAFKFDDKEIQYKYGYIYSSGIDHGG